MNRIPKIIHYCWFGGRPLPPQAVRCIASWKKHCPDYEIIEWSESNFDVNLVLDAYPYVKEALAEKKWAFVTDVLRLYLVYTYGGIYMDTDVELLKPLDKLLTHDMFIGFESKDFLNTGSGFGGEKNHPVLNKMLDYYRDLSFYHADGSLNTTPTPVYITKILSQEGLRLNNKTQTVNGIAAYSTEYLCPLSFKTRKLKITKNTYSIHHFFGAWLTDEQQQMEADIQQYAKRYGRFLAKMICHYKRDGIRGFWEKIKRMLRSP